MFIITLLAWIPLEKGYKNPAGVLFTPLFFAGNKIG